MYGPEFGRDANENEKRRNMHIKVGETSTKDKKPSKTV